MNTQIQKLNKAHLSENRAEVATLNRSSFISMFRKNLPLIVSIGSVLSLLVLWFVVTTLKIIPELFLPSPAAVWQKASTSGRQTGFPTRPLVVPTGAWPHGG